MKVFINLILKYEAKVDSSFKCTSNEFRDHPKIERSFTPANLVSLFLRLK